MILTIDEIENKIKTIFHRKKVQIFRVNKILQENIFQKLIDEQYQFIGK